MRTVLSVWRFHFGNFTTSLAGNTYILPVGLSSTIPTFANIREELPMKKHKLLGSEGRDPVSVGIYSIR